MGFVGQFDLRGHIVGTIRMVPLGHDLTLTELLLKQPGVQAPERTGTQWEVGRLVLAPDFRADVDTLRRCLYLSLSYASSITTVGDLFASCTHVLGRLYRRFAFSTFATDVYHPSVDKSYTLIHGRAPQVLRALAGVQQ